MECMEASRALKSSFSSELPMKTVTNNNNNNTQGVLDDFWCVTGEDFSVDEFFDLPNEDTAHKDDDDAFFEEDDEGKDDSNSSLSPSSPDPVDNFSTQLAIPDDDMQELELWSHLMDDSVPEPSLACPKPIMEAYNKKKTGFGFMNRVEPAYRHGVSAASFFASAVPVKPRSKRARTIGNRTWFSGSPPKAESESSSSSLSLSPSSPVSTLLYPPPVHGMGMFFTYGKPPAKKQKKRPAVNNGETGSNPAVQRRCSHCQVTKTPQWRAGPNGPKTLCNACGVRFKSGRLFPEYRPACSPTFSSEVHSNSHRKVLEMRRKKETEPTQTGSSS